MIETYTIASTAVGNILLAASDWGVRWLVFGRDAGALECALDRFRGDAPARRDDEALALFVGAVRRFLDGELTALDLPVDVVGSPFEQRVWAALRDIPAGETRSYGAVARAFVDGATAQEVAAACAANPVALVVPCHRVVRSDGTLGGYRWGAWRKRALLAIEATAAATGTAAGAVRRAA
jgi:AraC family transcriptional regulator of adaptative response/methylated-DNA-[protein]-cysteine methyltransferase